MRLLHFLAPPLVALLLLDVGSAHAQQTMRCMISAKGVGPVQLGMTLRRARNAFPQARFTRTTDGEGVALVGVLFAKTDLMVLYAGEDNPDAAIDWSRKIEIIETFHSGCKMANGVGPGTLITDVEKRLGKVKKISLSEIESREYVDFANQPDNFWFRLDYTGVFPEGARITKKFQPDARIFSIAVVPKRQ